MSEAILDALDDEYALLCFRAPHRLTESTRDLHGAQDSDACDRALCRLRLYRGGYKIIERVETGTACVFGEMFGAERGALRGRVDLAHELAGDHNAVLCPGFMFVASSAGG